MIETYDIESREQWLALRMQDVTASDIGAVARVSPFKSYAALYAEKTGKGPMVKENAAMEQGRYLEAAAFEWLRAKRPNWKVRRGTQYFRDPDLRIGCTPDVIVDAAEGYEGQGIVQIKTTRKEIFESEWVKGDDLEGPLHYQLQTITEAKITGAKWAFLLVGFWSFNGIEFEMVEVPVDEGAWDRLKREVAAFWKMIEAGEMPEIDPARDFDTVKALWKREDEKAPILDLTDNNRLPIMLEERAKLNEQIKSAQDRMKEIDTEVIAIMKEAPEARLPNWKITFKTVKTKEYTVAARESRQLRIYSKEEKAA